MTVKTFLLACFLHILLFTVLALPEIAGADEKNGLPPIYDLMDGKTPINIHFADVIEDRYIVDVEWFPDNGLAPLLTGPANITFTLVDRDISFTKTAELFHIPNFRINEEKIIKGEVFELKYIHLFERPFTFGDVNFDDTKELLIVEKRGGQRFNDAYQVHLIQEIEGSNYFNVLDLTKTKPYSEFDESTKLSPEDNTIWINYSGGACSSEAELYERIFSDYQLGNYQFKLINKLVWYYWDDAGNDIGCHVNAYKIVNGEEVLIESQSGPVDEITNTS